MLQNIIVESVTIDTAWDNWYTMLKSQYDNADSRDGGIRGECLNAITILNNPTNNIMNNDIRKLSHRYMIGEFIWYMSQSLYLSDIQKYTKGWDRMSDDGIHVNSNYGYKVFGCEDWGFNQFKYCENELRNNTNSRRAIIQYKRPHDIESKDICCTVCQQFFIRDGKLYSTVYMRSNDIWCGFPYDIFWFTSIQIMLSMVLHIPIGSFTHIAGSLHLYERDVK